MHARRPTFRIPLRRLRGAFFLLAGWCAVCVAARAQMPGDADCDGQVDEADLGALTRQLFSEDEPPCAGADANEDGVTTAADVPGLITVLYTPPPPPGPRLTFLGLAGSDGRAAAPLGFLPDGTGVYFRSAGFGFQLVVEAAPGPSGAPVGTVVFDSAPGDPTRRPDLQIQVDRPLGNASRAVCDEFGVPAVNPPDFAFTQPISNALNDLACRFFVATSRRAACTQDQFGQLNFMAPGSRVQFCLQVNSPFAFPAGDTVVTVRVRDQAGNVGPTGRLIVRVGSGPMPPTFTPLPPTATRRPTATRTPSRTRTPTRIPTPTPSGRPTSSPTATGPRTDTPTPGPTTGTATRTRTPTRTPSPTPAAGQGPIIVFFGLLSASDRLIEPEPRTNPNDPGEIRVYKRPFGSGFSLVVEARPGASNRSVRLLTFDQFGCPDFQILAARPLGNGSPAVCDTMPPNPGGVPGTDPPTFSDDPFLCARLNDFGCRFQDGAGNPRGRACTEHDACVRFDTGDFGCASPQATAQFCGFVATTTAFPPGDTLLSARARDQQGNFGPPAQIIVRIEP